MRKTIAVLGSVLFFAVAPTSVAGLVPWWITHWAFRPPFFDLGATRAVGILLIVAGVPVIVDSFARFALQGLGTPAPIARLEKRRIIQPKIMPMKPACLSGDWTPGAICRESSGRTLVAERSGEAASNSRHGALEPGAGFRLAFFSIAPLSF